MALAIFDLDNTLIRGDSDHAWGEYLVEQKIVDDTHYAKANDQFYRDYVDGTLDIHQYLEFVAKPLTRFTPSELDTMRDEFIATKVDPILLPKALELIEKHRTAGDTLLIITATNQFVTQPIAQKLGIEHLLASQLATDNEGRFTGKVHGTPCFQGGKITRLSEWLEGRPESLEGSYFYSDSMNDLPLLEQVSYPTAVDPDYRLQQHAEEQGWPVISLR